MQLLDGDESLDDWAARDEAKQMFERLLALRNDVGLLAEEWDTENDRMVGEFSAGAFAYRDGACGVCAVGNVASGRFAANSNLREMPRT